ncbi:MAG: 50S ribosomal protein L11 methyltransferase [bacterium]|nr:50S ribosomal protein L11 methyltransferase [bacterium]
MEILEWVNRIVTILFFLTAAAVAGIYGIVAVSLRREAPYVPSPKKVAEAMMELADVKPGETVIDLGSGDGTILLAAAKRGAHAIGYEMSYPLVWWTRVRAWMTGHGKHITVYRKDLFLADIRSANVVSCYLMPVMLTRLRDIFQTQLASGSRVVVSRFIIEDWAPVKQEQVEKKIISLYRMS